MSLNLLRISLILSWLIRHRQKNRLFDSELHQASSCGATISDDAIEFHTVLRVWFWEPIMFWRIHSNSPHGFAVSFWRQLWILRAQVWCWNRWSLSVSKPHIPKVGVSSRYVTSATTSLRTFLLWWTSANLLQRPTTQKDGLVRNRNRASFFQYYSLKIVTHRKTSAGNDVHWRWNTNRSKW
jgi:hypothetical protein